MDHFPAETPMLVLCNVVCTQIPKICISPSFGSVLDILGQHPTQSINNDLLMREIRTQSLTIQLFFILY